MPKADYPPDLVERVRELYDAGHTMRETAELAGTTVRVLQRLMPRNGIDRRPAIPRDQRGPRNASWKGASAGYAGLHVRVEAARGRPQRCDDCGTEDPSKRYEWANRSGRYTDVNDYDRLCAGCHRRRDNARRKVLGKSTIPARLRGGGG